MTKDEFAIYLTENGFPASVVDGTVMVTMNQVPSPADIKLVLQLKEQAGYNSSFGWKTQKKGG